MLCMQAGNRSTRRLLLEDRLTHVRTWQCRPAWADSMASELIADKTAAANILEEMPQCDSRLIYRESYITLSHMLGLTPTERP